MITYLPDTNILIDALNGKRGRKELLHDLVMDGHQLASCAVTVSEVFSGVRPGDTLRIEQFFDAFRWYETTRAVAQRAGRIRFETARQGITLALPDVLVAATALEHDLTVITENRNHFPMPDLKLYPL